MSKIVDLKCGNLVLTDQEMYFLDLYKQGSDAVCPDPSLEEYSFLHYTVLNRFFIFLRNPNFEDDYFITFNQCLKIIEMALSIMDVACRYGLNQGQIYDDVYRAENALNIDEYEKDGMLNYTKSTSRYIPSSFLYEDRKMLKFNIKEGFYPYINMDKIVSVKYVDGEAEFLFPPFLKCHVSGNTMDNGYDTLEVSLDNTYEDDSKSASMDDIITSADKLCRLLRDARTDRILEIKNPSMTESIKMACDILRNQLISYSNAKYFAYQKIFNKKYYIKANKVYKKNDGILDAIRMYISNPHFPFGQYNIGHTYALFYLVDRGFIDEEILQFVSSNNDLEQLKNFLCADHGNFRSMTNEEYDNFLHLFDVAFGINNEILQDRIYAANRICDYDLTFAKFEKNLKW